MTAREIYNSKEPIGPNSTDAQWRERMKDYIAVIGEETKGMSVCEFFRYSYNRNETNEAS